MKLSIKKITMGLFLGVFTSLSGCGEPAFVGDTGEPAGGGFTKPASAEYAIKVSGTGTGGADGGTRDGGTPATVVSGESFSVNWNVALNTNVSAWDIRIYWSETAAVTNASQSLFDETCDSAGQVCTVPVDNLTCTYTQAQTGNGGNITCMNGGTETANIDYTFASNPVFMVFEACGVGTNNCDIKGIIVNLS